MKKILAVLITTLISMPVQAEDWKSICGSYAQLAVTIMDGRQSGVPMSALMSALADPSIKEQAENIIISAYEVPRYRTKEMHKRAGEEFRDEVYLDCAKGFRTKRSS